MPNIHIEVAADPLIARDSEAISIDCFGRTDRGTQRADNEDHFLIAELWRVLTVTQCTLSDGADQHGDTDRLGYLCAIADGMGGHAAGELASRAALEAIERHLLSELALDVDVGQALRNVVRHCEESVRNIELTEEVKRPPGTTLTAAVIVGRKAHITHVGDSRAYLIRSARPTQITADHTLAEWLDREGLGKSTDGQFEHVLVNAIGGGTERAIVDTTGFELLRNDALLLCSDGLTQSVSEREIADVVSDATSASESCDRLLSMALERDGGDNITVVVARVT